jgi:hypothetical protein
MNNILLFWFCKHERVVWTLIYDQKNSAPRFSTVLSTSGVTIANCTMSFIILLLVYSSSQFPVAVGSAKLVLK